MFLKIQVDNGDILFNWAIKKRSLITKSQRAEESSKLSKFVFLEMWKIHASSSKDDN